MLWVDKGVIFLRQGDTGSVDFRARGYTFAAEDRAIFTLKNRDGRIVKHGVYELEGGQLFNVNFLHADTSNLPFGEYTYDVRYVIHPYYDGNGNIITGDQVVTPRSPRRLVLQRAVGYL